jgi:general secretion pathway protein M
MSSMQMTAWLPGSIRDRRIVAIALVVLALALVIAAIAVPVVLLNRYYDEHLARMTRQIKSQSALNVARPQLVRALESLKAKDPRKYYLRGTTTALAAAELQDQVKQLIESAGGKVILVQGIANKDDGAHRTVGATFHLNVSSSSLRRILHTVETREPFLFIDNLTIRALVPPGFRPQPGAPEPDVFVQMDVAGIVQVAPDPAGTPPPPAGGNRVSGGTKS